eukprot:667759_1
MDEWILNQIDSKETKILSVIPCWNATLILVSTADGFEDEKEQPIERVANVNKEKQTKCKDNEEVSAEIQEEEQKFNDDDNDNEKKQEKDSEDVHVDGDEDESIEKQFKLFLKKSKATRYFDKFAEDECCNMQSIRYFDDEFLSQDIGMKSKILRKTFLRECNKMV